MPKNKTNVKEEKDSGSVTVYKRLDETEREGLELWWENLQANRGECAALRRCGSTGEAGLFMATIKLGELLWRHRADFTISAVIAGVLAHVRSRPVNLHFARALAMPGSAGQSKPVFSEMRFRRLVKSRTPDELYTSLRRAVAILPGERANLLSIADGILLWNTSRFYASSQTNSFQIEWGRCYFEQISRNNK